jgi:hypothetical protein
MPPKKPATPKAPAKNTKNKGYDVSKPPKTSKPSRKKNTA